MSTPTDALNVAGAVEREYEKRMTEEWRELTEGPRPSARDQEIRDLLRSAHAIARRRGEGTAWERFAKAISDVGIGPTTARTFRVLPSDQEAGQSQPSAALASSPAAGPPDTDLPTYTDELELRYAEACEERDHLRSLVLRQVSLPINEAMMEAGRKAIDEAPQSAPSLPASDAGEQSPSLPGFEPWWEAHGQFCRAGGGDYERTFAFRAWEAATDRAALKDRP